MTSFNPIRDDFHDLEIYWNALLSSRGVTAKENKTWWNSIERKNHINFLKLKAALYGLKCFAKNLVSCQVLLRIDNTTAICYINKMGSI